MPLFVSDPSLGNFWSSAVAQGRVWVANGGIWERVLQAHLGEDLSTGVMKWTQVYRWPGPGPAMTQPVGFVQTYVASTEVRLVVTNRFETWRLSGTWQAYTGGALVSTAFFNVLADLYSIPNPGIVNGEVRFSVSYNNPDTGASSGTSTFSLFLGNES